MSFINYPMMFSGLLIIIIMMVLIQRYEKSFFNKVKMYWFMDMSKSRKISFALFLLSFVTFAISLGDLRGKEILVESNVPLQKTVVLIDSSASMLVEDVRPNRIKKAGLIARHFIRNSFGHQVSLSVFSDIQKKIVPFTDDIEILEARLQTLMDSQPKGSSNLSLAIKEASQYFKGKDGYGAGNILLITDGEEHSSVKIELPKEINLAIVGIGSEKGGRIPLRRRDGSFARYKKFGKTEVISKLNKSFFTNLLSEVASGKIWYVQSYSLPTEQILKFFSTKHKESFSKGSFRQRPVSGYWLIKLAVVFFVLSVVFSRFKSFVPVMLICLISFNSFGSGEKEALLNKFKVGNISKKEKLRLAEIFSRTKGEEKKSVLLYQNALKDIDREGTEDLFNFGTSLLKTGNVKDGIELYKYLDDNRSLSPEMSEVVKKHIQLAFNKQKKKKGGKGKDDKKKQDKKDKKDKKENKEDKKSSKGKPQKDNKKNKEDKKDKNKKKKDGKSGKDDKDKEDKDKKDKKKDEGNKDKKKKNKKKKWDDVKKQVEKKKKTSTVKGVLKQIMNDDGNLQRKFLDTSSENKKNGMKDW
ncbi:MAG: hypothetical protein BM556_09570 [Bacteriovorax sp. MedPE-SWde]|mgnify:CR=1 FL=1|nr:MAG: hypothetical protein BM556_09570 [Bacteriovorax sp. MedPE-SWde]